MNREFSKKNLLVFAHPGEAKEFFKAYLLTSLQKEMGIEGVYEGVYEGETLYLLISGEGIQAATQSLSSFLAVVKPSVFRVINFGVAGALDPSLKEGSLVGIRTAYAEKEKSIPEFKSFETSLSLKVDRLVDCLTVRERVHTKEKKEHLRGFAPVIDRELWAVGSVSKFHQLPFESYKVISDFADGEEMCSYVRSNTERYSKQFLSFYQENFLDANFKNEMKGGGEEVYLILEKIGFYFTASQRCQLDSLLNKNGFNTKEKQQEWIQSEMVSYIIQVEKNKKKRSSLLLKELNININPLRKRVEEEIQQELLLFKKAGVRINYDSSMEIPFLDFYGRISNQNDLEVIRKAFNSYTHERIEKIFNGQFELD